MEEWKLTHVSNKYEVSSIGGIRRIKPSGQPIIKVHKTEPRGVIRVMIHRRFLLVHRLVAIAFIENPNNKPEINHIDGNPSNNEVSNLEWVTASENLKHSYKIGIRQPNRKIPDCKINEIKKLYQSGNYTQWKIANIFSVNQSVISTIINGLSYQNPILTNL